MGSSGGGGEGREGEEAGLGTEDGGGTRHEETSDEPRPLLHNQPSLLKGLSEIELVQGLVLT